MLVAALACCQTGEFDVFPKQQYRDRQEADLAEAPRFLCLLHSCSFIGRKMPCSKNSAIIENSRFEDRGQLFSKIFDMGKTIE